eukprot:3387344-Pyramimonas_sp.AAC.1
MACVSGVRPSSRSGGPACPARGARPPPPPPWGIWSPGSTWCTPHAWLRTHERRQCKLMRQQRRMGRGWGADEEG